MMMLLNNCAAGIVEAAEKLPDVTAVLRRVNIPSLEHYVVVDVVCCQGQTWVKVVARNSKALASDLNGKCSQLSSLRGVLFSCGQSVFDMFCKIK